MSRTYSLVAPFVMALALAPRVDAAEIALVPVNASGAHTLNGDEIILIGGGQRVFLELQVSGWDPDADGSPALRGFQASIDSWGYASGLRGTLTVALSACSTAADCMVPFGGACSFNGNPCTQTSQCTFPQFGETCKGARCEFPTGVGGFCNPGFILQDREDYVFKNLDGGDLPVVDLSTPDYRFASAGQNSAMVDPGTPRYAGSLVLDVPAGALGTFTIPLLPVPDSVLQDNASQFILPLTLHEARITVRCGSGADCDDGSDCTNDACVGGVCSNTPAYDAATECCDPNSGSITQIDDSNACTVDSCDPVDGSVVHDAAPDGTPCDDGLFCTVSDFCAGAVCVGGGERNCDDAIDCTDVDSCNEAQNRCDHTANDAFCPDDGLYCNGAEFCDTATGCGHRNPPCSGPCDEDTDACGCTAPALTSDSVPRYLHVKLEPPGPLSIVIEPRCTTTTTGDPLCVGVPRPFDSDSDGIPDVNLAPVHPLGDAACPFLSIEQWGDLWVYGEAIVPEFAYDVTADCGTPGAPSYSLSRGLVTAKYGDVAGLFASATQTWDPPNEVVQILDVLAALGAFTRGHRAPPLQWADEVSADATGIACTPDAIISILDLIATLDGFVGRPYSVSTGCPEPCP